MTEIVEPIIEPTVAVEITPSTAPVEPIEESEKTEESKADTENAIVAYDFDRTLITLTISLLPINGTSRQVCLSVRSVDDVPLITAPFTIEDLASLDLPPKLIELLTQYRSQLNQRREAHQAYTVEKAAAVEQKRKSHSARATGSTAINPRPEPVVSRKRKGKVDDTQGVTQTGLFES